MGRRLRQGRGAGHGGVSAAEGENEMRKTVRRLPFAAWAIAVWWLGEEWQVLDVRVEPCGVVGHAEALGKEAKHERA